jgi:hypothetical protein
MLPKTMKNMAKFLSGVWQWKMEAGMFMNMRFSNALP